MDKELQSWQVRDKEDAEKAAESILQFANVMADEDRIKFFVERMLRAHPTLQQSCTRLVLAFLKGLAESEYVDGRNEYAQQAARKCMAALENEIGMPLI